MSHTRACRSSMPVFLVRWNPDDVTLPNFLDLTAPLLNPAPASRNDQSLTQRMAVPCCPSPRLEGDAATRRVRGVICAEERINGYGTSEVFGWAFCGGLRATSRDLNRLRILE